MGLALALKQGSICCNKNRNVWNEIYAQEDYKNY